MNFVESLSLFSGLKSSSPLIEDLFFPVVPKKYITISTENTKSKQWDHFQEFINLISPILADHNISIVEIGENKISLNNIISLKGATNANHWSYIVKKSMLHVGPESFITQLAGFHNTPCVSLFSNTSPEYSLASWSKSEKQCNIGVLNEGCSPSFMAEENPKTINKISAEKIVFESLSFLGIENDFNKYEVFHIGNSYQDKLIEVVPDFKPESNFFPRSLINLRMDYNFEPNLIPYFANNRKISIISEDEIDINILLRCKKAIEAFYIKVTNKTKPDYLNLVKNAGINTFLIAEESEGINDIKASLFDWEIQEHYSKSKNDVDNSEKICDTTRYKSSKTIFSKNGKFSSKSSYKNNIKQHKDEIILRDDDFWDDIQYIKLYNLK